MTAPPAVQPLRARLAGVRLRIDLAAILRLARPQLSIDERLEAALDRLRTARERCRAGEARRDATLEATKARIRHERTPPSTTPSTTPPTTGEETP